MPDSTGSNKKVKYNPSPVNGHSEGLSKVVDKISEHYGNGDRSSVATSVLRGINHRGYGVPMKSNISNQGITFFTRPDLNLSYDNITVSRRLAVMGTKNLNSLPGYIRCILDPASNSGLFPKGHGVGLNRSKSALVDSKSAFVGVLTNNLTSLSGWPDNTIDSFTSEAGLGHEVWNQVDNYTASHGTFDLTAEFREFEGGLITTLIRTWMEYMSRVADGSMLPYPWSIEEKVLDYYTRIYRFVLDPTRTFVKHVISTIGYPTAVPDAAKYNFNSESPTAPSDSVGIPFKCLTCEVDDPITLLEFNSVVATFNPAMKDGTRESSMVKIPQAQALRYNFEGYPYIDLVTHELQWWMLKGDQDK